MTTTPSPQVRRSPHVTAPGLLALALLAATSLGGCAAAGFVTQAIMGPEKVDALYTPIDQSTVILIDDPSHQLTTAPLASVIAGVISGDLKREKVISEFIDPAKIDQLRVENSDFDRWPMDRIGQAVGAKQIIYVLVSQFSLASDNTQMLYKPGATVRVKVLETATGKRLFPVNDKLGQQVASVMYYKNMEGSRTTETVLSRELAQRLAEDTAMIFYKHEPRNEMSPNRLYQ